MIRPLLRIAVSSGLFLASLCCARSASAECTLPRSIVLPQTFAVTSAGNKMPPAMDAKLRCEQDQDNNGLDDEMEVLLGECLAPRLKFNSGYFEPPASVMFNARAIPVNEGVQVSLHYGLAWPEDFGHVAMDCAAKAKSECLVPPLDILDPVCYLAQKLQCNKTCIGNNKHVGDMQTLTVNATVNYAFGRWTVAPASITGQYGGHGPAEKGRFNIYLTPGKHHFYGLPQADDYYETGPAKYNCADPHDGSGGELVIDHFLHVPIESAPGQVVGGGYYAGLDDALLPQCNNYAECEGAPWVNQCMRDLRGIPDVPSTHFGLVSSGIPGCPFFQHHLCGESDEPGGAGLTMAYPLSDFDDMDGDGEKNHEDPCPAVPAAKTVSNNDDGDGLVESCDLDPLHENTYVGKGGERLDGVHVIGTIGTLSPANPLAPVGALGGGYGDFDGDNVADGRDLCPSNAATRADVGVSSEWLEADWNQSGMALNIDEAGASPQVKYISARTGYAHRGNVCDPYPVTRTVAVNDAEIPVGPPRNVHFCKGLHEIVVGAKDMPIQATTYIGVSANDAAPAAEKSLMFNAYRCNCQGEQDCLRDPGSACWHGRMRVAAQAPLWSGWRPAHATGCQAGLDTFCEPTSRVVPVGAQALIQTKWSWFEEKSAWPLHFKPDTFVDSPPNPLNPEGVVASADFFAIRTMFDEGGALSAVPGSALSHSPTLSVYGEPDVGSDGALLGIDSVLTDKNRRLRASEKQGALAPSTEWHSYLDTGECLPPWQGDMSFLDDPVLEIDLLRQPILELGDRLVVGTTGPKFGDIAFLDGRANLRRRATLASSAPGWIRDGDGAVAKLSSKAVPVIIGDSATRLLGGKTALFWIERGLDSPARWAVLQASGQSSETTTYVATHEGVATFLVSSSAVVVGDASSGYVAVVDSATGLVAAYDVATNTWTKHEVAAARRVDASLVLDGTTLFVVGGSVNGALASTVELVDIVGGGSFSRSGFPTRRRPVATLARDDHALVLGGGTDSVGVVHDDVWVLDFPNPLAAPYKLRADTVGTSMVAGKVLLDVRVKAKTVDGYFQTPEGWTEARSRVDGGWRGTDESAPPACEPSDAVGGQLCVLPQSGPWSSPGRLTCSISAPPHACQGSAGEVLAVRSLSVPSVVEVDVSSGALWALSPRSIERRLLREDLTDRSTTTVPLPATARDLSVTDEGALIATDAGFAWVGARSTSAVTASACGKAVKVVSLGGGTWAGVTTIGVALISTASGTPVITQQALLLPRRNDDGLELTRLPPGAIGRVLCQASERAIGSRAADALGDATSLAAISSDSFLVSRGPIIGRVRASSAEFDILGWALAPGGIEGIRVDDVGNRAYVDLRHGERTLDLRGDGIVVRAGVGIASWVDRHDAGSLSATLTGATVKLARVRR